MKLATKIALATLSSLAIAMFVALCWSAYHCPSKFDLSSGAFMAFGLFILSVIYGTILFLLPIFVYLIQRYTCEARTIQAQILSQLEKIRNTQVKTMQYSCDRLKDIVEILDNQNR